MGGFFHAVRKEQMQPKVPQVFTPGFAIEPFREAKCLKKLYHLGEMVPRRGLATLFQKKGLAVGG
jgi:hypothetical protein